MQIPLSLIKASQRPVRTSWDEEKMEELAQSIREQGVIVPVKVRPVTGLPDYCMFHAYRTLTGESAPANESDDNDDHAGECNYCEAILEWVWPSYVDAEGCDVSPWDQQADEIDPKRQPFEIVYGHRRVEAARRAGLAEIEAIIDGIGDTAATAQALIENIQREDMQPMDEARAYALLLENAGWSQAEIALRVGKVPSRIASMLALLREPMDIQEILRRKDDGRDSGIPGSGIGEHHVREARKALPNDLDARSAVLRKANTEGLNTIQTGRVAQAVAAAPTEEAKSKLLEWEYSPTVHDPEFIRSRAKEYGAHDPMYREPAPHQNQQWKETPEVAAAVTGIIDGAKRWQTLIEEVRKMVEIGKMSPEARRFVAHRVRALANTLAEWAKELEE